MPQEICNVKKPGVGADWYCSGNNTSGVNNWNGIYIARRREGGVNLEERSMLRSSNLINHHAGV